MVLTEREHVTSDLATVDDRVRWTIEAPDADNVERYVRSVFVILAATFRYSAHCYTGNLSRCCSRRGDASVHHTKATDL